MDIKKKIKINNDKPSNQAKKMRIVKWMWTIFVAIGLIGVFSLLLIYNGVIGYMPPIEELKNPHDKFASIIYANDGTTELGRYYSGMGNRVYADYDDISSHMIDALIATDVDIEIFGADGRSVLRCESASQSVDVSDLPSGVYIVRANFSGRTIEEKIVVR